MMHIDNVPHILKYGITHASSLNYNKQYVPIGDGSLINSRAGFVIPNGKKIGNYIPFYFGGRMPMLYVIQRGFNNVTAVNPQNIIYCVLTVKKVIENNLEFVFTNGHAVDRLSEFFELKDVPLIGDIVDFNAVKEQYWNNENDLDLKRRKEAEFLIGCDIPVSTIAGYIVYDETTSIKLMQMGADKDKITVRTDFYF